MKLVFRDVPEDLWLKAMAIAKTYRRDYPDRMGIHQCAIYTVNDTSLIVYRTKTSLVVRGA